MKLSKYISIVLLSAVFVSGCSSVKNTLSGKKKNNADEFLVKRKNPLVLPPDFDVLPKPQEENVEDNIGNEDLDLSDVLNKSKGEKQIIKKKENSLERSISKILNSN